MLLSAVGLVAWEFRPVPECMGMFDHLLPNPPRCRPSEIPTFAAGPDFGAASEKDKARRVEAPAAPSLAPRFSGVPVDHDPFAPPLDFRLAGFFLAVGVAIYAACRALGWIINGFTGR